MYGIDFPARQGMGVGGHARRRLMSFRLCPRTGFPVCIQTRLENEPIKRAFLFVSILRLADCHIVKQSSI